MMFSRLVTGLSVCSDNGTAIPETTGIRPDPIHSTDSPLAASLSTSAPSTTGSVADGEDLVVVLPVRDRVLFPGVVLPVVIKREKAIAGAQEAVRAAGKVGFLLQKDPTTEVPGFDDLQHVGTLAGVMRHTVAPDGTYHLVCQGERRFRVLNAVADFPYLVARVEYLADSGVEHPQIEAHTRYLREKAREAMSLLPQAPAELANRVLAIESPSMFADTIANYLDVKPAEKQELLETLDLYERIERVGSLLTCSIEMLKISRQIEQRTKDAIDGRQREIVLREKLRQIQKELGDQSGSEELAELGEAITRAGMPQDIELHARNEIKRVERMNEASSEYSTARTYLDTLIALPWSTLDDEEIDITHVRGTLDADHFGLDKIKRRIVEYLAVRKLSPEGPSAILCFVGPPGVGKTSLGQSIARALGLKFQRISLGGVHDEAEIRGHRRTYVGALPGAIIQALRKAGTRNPVLMLDEIDKLGNGIHGDPAAALLEVLDPEQNSSFRDNYLGVACDLSKVLFIATANQLDTIPGPLRDRMEIIELTGYTEDEKVEIARRYLVRRQLKVNGLRHEQATVTDGALRRLARDYTREAGCRNLEREIGAVLRNVAVRIAEGLIQSACVDVPDVAEIRGQPRFENDVAMRVSVSGVATGLAWTPTGGYILFIEATCAPGTGKLILTGQLGDVMKESAQAALSLVKSQAEGLGLDTTLFERSDIHMHIPAGSIPKDGPSAGVPMYTALVSLLTGRPVRHDVAMTGEISLRGLVLPVGGIKEKTIAAHRAGIRTVLLPARNRRDLEDIPEIVRGEVEFVWLERVEEATERAFGQPPIQATSDRGELVLVNGHEVRKVPGCTSDMNDAQGPAQGSSARDAAEGERAGSSQPKRRPRARTSVRNQQSES